MDHSCILPCSPLAVCEYRFSILPENDHLQAPTWPLVVAVLNSPTDTVEHLIDHLETFAICLHGRTGTDFGQLSDFLKFHWHSDTLLGRVYPVLVSLALDLPNLFPEGVLPILTPSSPSRTLTRHQIACFIVHQFFCTLSPPSWMPADGSVDFHIWYRSPQSHPGAVHAYLWALFTYFERLAFEPWITYLPASEWPINLTLRSLPESTLTGLDPGSRHFIPLTIRIVHAASTRPSLLGLPFGACVVSANKYIGFGRTGTQEETHIGCSPEAFPALLFVPPLQDNQVFVLEGVEANVTIEGYGRGAALGRVLETDYSPETYHTSPWLRRTMLFMDALELDQYDAGDGVADLLPGHLGRELTKAYIAFSSREKEPYSEIMTGLWGCGAFGGNAEIKTILQWCAASMVGVPLTFVCHSGEQVFLEDLRTFSIAAIEEGWTVADVLSTLRSLRPDDESSKHALTYTSECLSRKQ